MAVRGPSVAPGDGGGVNLMNNMLSKVVDYKNGPVEVDYLSTLSPADGEALVGKVIRSVSAHEYTLFLTFTDGTTLKCEGHTWDGCSMGAEYDGTPISDTSDVSAVGGRCITSPKSPPDF